MDAAADSKADTLAAPPSDFSRLLPNQTLATPTVTASNGPPAAPLQPSPPAVALSDQPRVQPTTTRDLSAEPVQEALSTPPSTPPDFNPNEPYAKKTCRDVPNGTVTGRATSSTTIQMPGFSCVSDLGGQNRYYKGGSYCFSLACPCQNHATSDPIFGRVCLPLLTMTVQLANRADASKMPLGKLVTLKGDFFVITQNKIDYLFVQNARVLYVDPFDRHAEADQLAPKVVASSAPPAAPPRLDPNEPYKITRCNVPNGARTCDLVTLASTAAPGPGSIPRTRTELAMKCWLGLVEYKGCWQSLCGDGEAGPLEKVQYLGRTAAGADIYQVRYRYRAAIAYGIVPDPQGTADQYLVKATDPYWIKREISSPAAPVLIYARPEDAAPCIDNGNFGGQLNPAY
jgi:hypothetical protein